MKSYLIAVFAFGAFAGCAKPHQFETYTTLGGGPDGGNCEWVVKHGFVDSRQKNDVLLYCCVGVVSDTYSAQPTWNKAPSCIKAESGIVVTPPSPVVPAAAPKENFPSDKK